MATARLKQTSSKIEDSLNQMVERGSTLVSFLQTHTFKQYQNAQAARWQTEGSSENFKWPDIGDEYKQQKIRIVTNAVKHRKKVGKRAASSRPENNMTPSGVAAGGKVLMILTGRLIDAATGKSAALLKTVSNSGMRLAIDDSVLPYGKWVAVKRQFMKFSPQTEKQMMDDVVAYLMTGEK
jgi:hypothetical protein